MAEPPPEILAQIRERKNRENEEQEKQVCKNYTGKDFKNM